MVAFPRIPTIVDGQVLGATALNSYRRAQEYLLAESHAPTALQHSLVVQSTSGTSYTTAWHGYLYLEKASLYYRIQARQNSGSGKTYYVLFQYYGDDSAWHDIVEITGTDAAYAFKSGTVDISGEAQITAGNIYIVRMRIKTSDGSYDTYAQYWTLREIVAVSGWTAVTDFANAATSAEADFNDLKTDLDALYNMVSPVIPLTAAASSEDIDTNWDTYGAFFYRYRPDTLVVKVRVRNHQNVFDWRVLMDDTSGNQAVLYLDEDNAATGDYSYNWHSATLRLTSGSIYAAIVAAGISLTLGGHYRITIQGKKDSAGFSVLFSGAFVVRESDQAPLGSWDSDDEWVHGNTQVGETRLDKIGANLTELYTGGAEELWGENATCSDGDSHNIETYSGVHRKRWLYYKRQGEPAINYGTDFGDSHDLDDDAGWHNFDLNEIDIPWGGYYYVTGVDAAFESDSAL